MFNFDQSLPWLRITMLALASILVLSAPAQAAFIGLAWDPNPEADIAGYVLVYGTASGSYTNSVDVGNTTTWSGSALTDGQQYFFAVRAYNTSGVQSDLSSEVSAKPFSAAKILTPLPGSTLNGTSARLQWSAGAGASNYRVSVGTGPGAVDIFDQSLTKTTVTVPGIPGSGAVFVRLWSLIGATWHFADYTYASGRAALSIDNVSINEGNTGSKIGKFTVSLTTICSEAVTVKYTTASGTATAGNDYVTVSGTLTFKAGITTQPVKVSIVGDRIREANETFAVTLSEPSTNAIVATQSGAGTILNDDVSP